MLDSLLIYELHVFLVGPLYQAGFSSILLQKTLFAISAIVFPIFSHPKYLLSWWSPILFSKFPIHTDPGLVAG